MKDVNSYGDYSAFQDDKYRNNTSYFDQEFGARGKADDFLLDGYHDDKSFEENAFSPNAYEPLIPSKNVLCDSVWLTMRSEMNYK